MIFPCGGFLNEKTVLKASVGATLLVAFSGIALGVASGSFSILFDGVHSLTDAVMSLLSLVVVSLITSFASAKPMPFSLHERFNMGFWHLEPMLILMNGLLLMGVATYALLNAVVSLANGGRELNFDLAIVYAVTTTVIASVMALVVTRANRAIRSEILRLDAKSWVMSGAISMALVVAFVLAILIEGTSWAWLQPYVDPTVVVAICLFVIPLPLSSVRQSLCDVLLITPPELKGRVDEVASAVVSEQGFLTFRSYVAKVGRSREIELYFIVKPDEPARPIGAWDALRDEISEAIGGDGPDRWLTITFTEDLDWA